MNIYSNFVYLGLAKGFFGKHLIPGCRTAPVRHKEPEAIHLPADLGCHRPWMPFWLTSPPAQCQMRTVGALFRFEAQGRKALPEGIHQSEQRLGRVFGAEHQHPGLGPIVELIQAELKDW